MQRSKYRRAVFIVTYAIIKDKPQYLLLKRKLHWIGWEFPKGGIEKKENLNESVKRELKEETGLTPIKIKSFKEKGKFNYVKEYSDRKCLKGQTYKLYAVEVKKKKVKIDKHEHSNFQWLSFKDAYKKLTWPNQRRCLRIVDDWLKKLS